MDFSHAVLRECLLNDAVRELSLEDLQVNVGQTAGSIRAKYSSAPFERVLGYDNGQTINQMDDQSGILQDIADSVRDRSCVLFLGAGVHAGPPAGSSYDYPNAQRPLIGAQVTEYLAQKSGFSDAGQIQNLQRVSLHFELEKGRSVLQNEIHALVQEKKKPSPIIKALAQLPFPIIITTNYDSHYEDAAASYGKSPFVSF